MCVCVCVCGSGDVAGAGEQQSGRGGGTAGGLRSGEHGTRVSATQSRDLRRVWQPPDEHLQTWDISCTSCVYSGSIADGCKPNLCTSFTNFFFFVSFQKTSVCKAQLLIRSCSQSLCLCVCRWWQRGSWRSSEDRIWQCTEEGRKPIRN